MIFFLEFDKAMVDEPLDLDQIKEWVRLKQIKKKGLLWDQKMIMAIGIVTFTIALLIAQASDLPIS